MKILIHTLFYQNYNFGGILQAYALYNFLRNLGCSCTELNYTLELCGIWEKLKYRKQNIFFLISRFVKNKYHKKKACVLREKYISYYQGDYLKEKFDQFMKDNFDSTVVFNPVNIVDLEKQFDCYIVGGDQVWNPDWTDNNFFLSYASKGKKIAFSCSAGKNHFTKNEKKKLLKNISNLDVISVREQNLSNLLNQNGILNQVIADPVFLFAREEWIKFSSFCHHIDTPYVFVYLLGRDKKCREDIICFARRNHLKIVAIPHVWREYNKADEDFADLEILNAGPKEFISLINNAEFILTDSFHGTAFSIILEKQFLSFSRFKNNDKRDLSIRQYSLLNEYNLLSRMIYTEQLKSTKISELEMINYDVKKKVTWAKRENAICFLKANLPSI